MSFSASEKSRIARLVREYTEAFSTHNLDVSAVKKRIPAFDESGEVSSLTKTFFQLAVDALHPPYSSYFLRAPDSLPPVHLIHLDANVLTLQGLASAKSSLQTLNPYLQRCLEPLPGEDFSNALLSFTDLPSEDFSRRDDLDELYHMFVEISRLNDNHFGAALLKLLPHCSIDPIAEVRLFSVPVRQAVLFARFLAFLVVTSPALSFHQTIEVARFIHGQLDTESTRRELLQALSKISVGTLTGVVGLLQENLSLQLYGGASDRIVDDNLRSIAFVIGILHEVNEIPPHERGLVSHEVFYNRTASDFDQESMKTDFLRKLENEKEGSDGNLFCFSNYPFLVDANFKSVMLQLNSAVQHRQALQNAMLGMLFTRNSNAEAEHFLLLTVQRDRLIQSTLSELSRKRDRLRKPLRVKFAGEEGIDEGGPRKEFFQLVCKELFDPNYGMFRFDEKQRFFWIQPTILCSGCKVEFNLIGQVLGLAVYNNVILDVAFPKVLFRKLLQKRLDFDDLAELDPDLAKGLETLLNFDEAREGATVEEVFCRSFVVEHEVFGERVTADLVPNGSQIQLTASNRQQYVDAVLDYTLNKSIQGNFHEFQSGFFSVCSDGTLQAFHPTELELLVCGNPTLNFAELEEATKYDGYSPHDKTIRLFWEVLREFTPAQQRLFLKFCTGSDRVPIRGLKDLGFVIGKNGDDSELLPTSHTCFNHLLLPQYKSKEVLRKKLLLAIENCTGFGLK
jgi:hypothetical protein